MFYDPLLGTESVMKPSKEERVKQKDNRDKLFQTLHSSNLDKNRITPGEGEHEFRIGFNLDPLESPRRISQKSFLHEIQIRTSSFSSVNFP